MAGATDAKEAIEIILNQKEDIRLLAITAIWFIWAERNQIREEGRRRSPEALVKAIKIYTNEFHQLLRHIPRTNERRREYWSKPPGVLKLNCDAAFQSRNMSGSWGFIVRDSDGDVVLAGSGRVNHLLSAFQAELIACLHGLQVAIMLVFADLSWRQMRPWCNKQL